MDFNNLSKEEKQQLINEGIMDWFRSNRDSYHKARYDDTEEGTTRRFGDIKKAGGVAGGIGTALGTGYKYLRKGVTSAAPVVGRGLKKAGEKLSGESKITSAPNSKLAAAVTAGVARASTGNKVGSPIGQYSSGTPGYARVSGTQKFIPAGAGQTYARISGTKAYTPPSSSTPKIRPWNPSSTPVDHSKTRPWTKP